MPQNALSIEDIIIPVESLQGPVRWPEIFANHHPLEVEIGAGKGTFLINAARANPRTNYLGIEWANKYCNYAADRARRWGLTNVRMLRCDARDFLARNVPPQSIRTLHIYFPDPWPKKRHHKRRLFSKQFVEDSVKALTTGGHIHLVTDFAEYFQVIEHLLRSRTHLQVTDFKPRETAQLGEWVGTNFERKYLTQGRVIYSCSARKTIDQPA